MLWSNLRRLIFFILVLSAVDLSIAQSQTADDVTAEVSAAAKSDDSVDVASKVEVDPVNTDEKIERRLNEIFSATGWFESATVRVDRGVAFLTGVADSAKHLQWAEATAINTSDVVAVVNQLEVAKKPFWNFAPAWASLEQIGRETTSVLPLLMIALIIVAASYYLARVTAWLTRRLSRRRIDSVLLRQVVGNVAAVLVFIVGVYIALRVSGLTKLAVTLLGGTGLVGLALGFAFRDIAENYLASILISLNHPFRVGDLIEVEDCKGLVRKVTTRGTILNTLDGNQIQLPNSTVYKGKILNYTATPTRRADFGIGIGFDDSIGRAQMLVMEVLRKHVAVESEPPPMVLVEQLGSATVNLRCYFWFNQISNSPLKVTSSVIRMVKQTLTQAGISMPDEARELIFPNGVPVQIQTLQNADASNDGEIGNQNLVKSTAGDVGTVSDVGSGPGMQEVVEVAGQGESEINIGEGDLSSEKADVSKATANDEIVDSETNLIG